MGWFVPWMYDQVMRGTEEACLADWRRALLAGASGRVLEIGAGTGVNLLHYPDLPLDLTLSEPDAGMRRRLEARVEALGRTAEILPAPSEALPVPDQAFDTVVSTLVCCTVPDLAATLTEARRVLRPGGRLLFLEHVAADDRPERLAWQRRIEPFWRLFAGGCRLTRRTADAIDAAGFEIIELERASMRRAPAWVRPTIRGVAIRR